MTSISCTMSEVLLCLLSSVKVSCRLACEMSVVALGVDSDMVSNC